MMTNTGPVETQSYDDVKTKPYSLDDLKDMQTGWQNHGMH